MSFLESLRNEGGEMKNEEGKTVWPQFTTERLYPHHVGEHGMDTYLRHLNRYKWATTNLKKADSVLDLGCGCGMFDEFILEFCRSIVGLDISEEAIKYAMENFAMKYPDRLMFRKQDASEIKLLNGDKFDAIICLEMIEHMDRSKQNKMMDLVSKILPYRDGRFIVSTPKHGQVNMTKFHEQEFKAGEFERYLHNWFYEVEMHDPFQNKIPDYFMLAVCRRPKR